MSFDPSSITTRERPHGMPFRIGKIGHVVLQVADLARSVDFYVNVLGMEVSDVYGEEMMAGGHGVPALQPRSPWPGAGRRAGWAGG